VLELLAVHNPGI